MSLHPKRSSPIDTIRLLALGLVIGWAPHAWSQAAEPGAADAEPGAQAPDPELVAGSRLSLPSPAAYFSALARSTNARWRRCYRVIEPRPPADRVKAGAGLGMLIAEAHLAAMARDGQRLSNVAAEITSYAKMLGLGELVTPALAGIAAVAEQGNWPSVHVRLEALLTEAGDALVAQRDGDLAVIATACCWVRALHVGTVVVGAGEVKDLTMAVGGEGMPQRLAALAEEIAEPMSKQEPVALMVRQLAKLGRVWSPEKLASREFSLEEVEDSRARLESIMGHLDR